MKFPSEREVLRCVAEMYESAYPGSRPGENDPYLPIDVTAVAGKLGCKPQLLFGYLYYYLDHKHRYETGPHTWTHLFAVKIGDRRHCVNYPYLAGILAAHDVEHTRSQWAIWLSVVALVLSLAAIIAQVATSGNT
jgi:hypothetical protein